MQLDLTRFRQPLSHVSRRLTPADLGDDADESFRVTAPVDLEFDLHKDKNRFRVVGQVRAELEVPCSRCLEPVPMQVDVPVDLRYWPESDSEAQEATKDQDVSTDDADTSYYRDDAIDLREMLREQFYLAMPMKPLCRETCLGLCPQCGSNRNSAPCACEPAWQDARLAGLREIVDHSEDT